MEEDKDISFRECFNYEGNWTEDFSHENGQYLHKCLQCGHGFIGHKRRAPICAICSQLKFKYE